MNYADVDHKGGGVVHFNNREGMEYALRKLDGSEFANRYDSAVISVSTSELSLSLACALAHMRGNVNIREYKLSLLT